MTEDNHHYSNYHFNKIRLRFQSHENDSYLLLFSLNHLRTAFLPFFYPGDIDFKNVTILINPILPSSVKFFLIT